MTLLEYSLRKLRTKVLNLACKFKMIIVHNYNKYKYEKKDRLKCNVKQTNIFKNLEKLYSCMYIKDFLIIIETGI